MKQDSAVQNKRHYQAKLQKLEQITFNRRQKRLKKGETSETAATTPDSTQVAMQVGDPTVAVEKVAYAVLEGTNDYYDVFRFRDRNGKHIHIALKASKACSDKLVRQALLDSGIKPLDAPRLVRQIKNAIKAQPSEEAALVISAGWYGPPGRCFVYGDRVLQQKLALGNAAPILFPCPTFDARMLYNRVGPNSGPTGSLLARKPTGTIQGWKDGVAKLALLSTPMILAICAGFAAPLLGLMNADPYVLLYTGPNSKGKTMAELVAASMIGIGLRIQIPNWNSTPPGLEELARTYSDMLATIDDLANLEGGTKSIFDEIAKLSHFFSSGAMKRKHGPSVKANTGQPALSKGVRTIVLTSYEHTLAEIEAANKRSFDGGVKVRFVEVPATMGRAEGVFDRLPPLPLKTELVKYTKQLTVQIKRACKLHNGRVFEAWIKALVNDPKAARIFVRAKQKEFIQAAAFNRNKSTEHRHSDTFAILYGAGAYAIELKLVPWTMEQLLDAVLTSHKRSLKSLRAKSPAFKKAVSNLGQMLQDPAHIEPWPAQASSNFAKGLTHGWSEQQGGMTIYRVIGRHFRRWFNTAAECDEVEQWLIDEKFMFPTKKGKLTKSTRVQDSPKRERCYEIRVPVGTVWQ